MNRFLIFAGTTEGRLLVSYLLKRNRHRTCFHREANVKQNVNMMDELCHIQEETPVGTTQEASLLKGIDTIQNTDVVQGSPVHQEVSMVEVHVCVASDYGASMLDDDPALQIHEGRKSYEEMVELMKSYSFCEVIDATHPYAVEVSRNIRNACKQTNHAYLRLRRETKADTSSVYVHSMSEALQYLKQTKGNIFVTTGSKELGRLADLPNFKERVYARVLSTEQVVKQCGLLGLEGKHLMCMQGPFDTDMNIAMMKHVQASYVLTKESGKTGGFEQKLEAAKRVGATSIVIAKPNEENGYAMDDLLHYLYRRYNLPIIREIAFVSIGVGNSKYLTQEAKEKIENADLLIGAKRMLACVEKQTCPSFTSYKPDEIQAYIHMHPEYEHIAILLSGDIGFYSAAKQYQTLFPYDEIQMIPGISSLVYFCGKLRMSWDDVDIVSMHGRKANVIAHVKEHEKVFVLLGTTFTANDLCNLLHKNGFSHVNIWIGERLSYENENIQSGTPASLQKKMFDPLCVALISHTVSPACNTSGWKDEVFERSNVPMTKSEIRCICLSKLNLPKDAIIYDIGAGSGSVAIEAAAVASAGEVYAIEHKQEAVDLIAQNKQKFQMEHLHIIHGMAPDCLQDLPVPTHAFIGGSNGKMEAIIQALFHKNPRCRIVLSAIAIETMSAFVQMLPRMQIHDLDIIQVQIAKSKALANYHMMTALNPIYIISFYGGYDEVA